MFKLSHGYYFKYELQHLIEIAIILYFFTSLKYILEALKTSIIAV